MSPAEGSAPKLYGRLSDGREVREATLSSSEGLCVRLLDYGATVRGVTVPTVRGPVEVAPGLSDLAAYEADAAYHGVMVGRCANRIGGAAFTLDGRRYDLTANEGSTCLHGGRLGLSKRMWRFERVEPALVSLAYSSPDGEEGFPGQLDCRVTFALVGPDSLRILWEAQADRPTPVNLTSHLYFNLTGDPNTTILDHELTIAAETITPVDDRLIPTGELMPVVGTPFDFRAPRRVGAGLAQSHPQLGPGKGYDHNWALSGAQPAVRLRSPQTGVVLEIVTDQPGMQVYGGQGLAAPFVPHGAIVFEPQGFPDAVHHPNFPTVILRPGEVYSRSALYRFSAGPAG